MKLPLTKELDQFKLVVFDLDHTLYDEHQYLYQAYESIGRKLEAKTGVSAFDITDFLKTRFEKHGRHMIFDQMRAHFKWDKKITPICLDILRGVKIQGKFQLFEAAIKTFEYLLEKNIKLAILTNGHPQQQRNKIAHIDWQGYDKHIKFYLAAEIEPKPSPAGMNQILLDFRLSPEEVAFIGDAKIDEECAKRSGVKFFWV